MFAHRIAFLSWGGLCRKMGCLCVGRVPELFSGLGRGSLFGSLLLVGVWL